MRVASLSGSPLDACPACGAAARQALKGFERDHLARCDGCGLVYADQIPTQSELDEVYAKYTRQELALTPISLAKKRALATDLTQRTGARRVLDIGCNEGTLLALFGELGCEMFGSEYDARAEAVCRTKGITMLPGGLKPQAGPELIGAFDLIVFTEVLEHINDPFEVLTHMQTLLRPGGMIYITTPNFASLERRLIGAEWGMICFPEHVTYWTPRTVHAFLGRVGLERIELRTENLSVYRIVQFLNRRRGASGGPQRDPEAASVKAQAAVAGNPLLQWIKQAVNLFLRASGTGSSLIALYRKPETGVRH